ncbi:glial cell line-derived neurotrophic factor-like isoform X2 [Echeneis naucrates]|uniref:glial cell line-derived neurotrophic factor-like isoform X2 n=1 Tax=Echeneis naucrates TaxID=173247 RepID=UPI0011146ABC|nr:glial cell line-derived neurotrophic factor-like isoform X2 [Echeneis naucrates]
MSVCRTEVDHEVMGQPDRLFDPAECRARRPAVPRRTARSRESPGAPAGSAPSVRRLPGRQPLPDGHGGPGGAAVRSRKITSPPSREKLGSSTQYRRERKKGASQQRAKGGSGGAGVGETGRKVRGGGGSGRGQGCVLKQIHLNVSDLGLGYRSGEEMIFRYCSGPCRKSETNYDKILSNLAHNRRLPPKDRPSQACCRPTAFDDDLSFLDDNLVYHTVRKHSARKCGCV